MNVTPDKVAWWAGSVFFDADELADPSKIVKTVYGEIPAFLGFSGIWHPFAMLHPDGYVEARCIIPTETITVLVLQYERIDWRLKPLTMVN